MLDKYYTSELNALRYNVARFAIDTKLRGQKISGICKELVNISYNSLKKQNQNEEKFLEPIMELLKKNKVPADYV